MKSELIEKELKIREKFFKTKITEILKQIVDDQDYILGDLQKSPLDIIHAYVKEISVIQRARYEITRI